MKLAELSNGDLARLFFAYLYHGYDMGGISCRRSLRSALVENYLQLVEGPTIDSHPSQYSVWSISEEAESRNAVLVKELQCPFLPFDKNQLEFLNIEEVAMLSLSGLKIWHEQYLRRLGTEQMSRVSFNEIDFSVESNSKMINMVCRLLPIPTLEAEVDVTELERKIYRYASNLEHYISANCAEFNWLVPRN